MPIIILEDEISDDSSSPPPEDSSNRSPQAIREAVTQPPHYQTVDESERNDSLAGASRKRRRVSHEQYDTTDSQDAPNPDDSATALSETASPSHARRPLDHIRPSAWVYPKSRYENWEPPLPVTAEQAAIEELKREWGRQNPRCADSRDAPSYLSFDLNAFSIYRPSSPFSRGAWNEANYDYKMEPLHQLNDKKGVAKLLFDGVLSVGRERRYVQGIPFKTLSIEGYGDDSLHTVSGIWIQSNLGKTEAIWYQLVQPAEEYQRYHEPFLWVANLSKHFLDFLVENDAICIRDFRQLFHDRLIAKHNADEHFRSWLRAFKSTDFRTAVAANIGFLFNESWNVNSNLSHRPLWSEIGPIELAAVPEQPRRETKTIVTPYVYECFKNMYFCKWLEVRHPTAEVLRLQHQRQKALGFTPNSSSSSDALAARRSYIPATKPHQGEYKIGDVVGVSRDERSIWKDTEPVWLAYVQGTRRDRKGQQLLDVIWMYRPADTTLSTMTYPIEKELFFSDNCNCGDAPFRASDVVYKVKVDWFPNDLNTQQDFLVRQKYCSGDQSFTTLRKTDFTCKCRTLVSKSELEIIKEKYQAGDSILFSPVSSSPSDDTLLEPAVIDSLPLGTEEVLLRRLLRHRRDLGHREARPNELVWTEDIFAVPAERVVRKCHIRFYTKQDLEASRIPVPYNRDGTADLFYITKRQITQPEHKALEDLQAPFLTQLNQGFDPTAASARQPLKGLSLFCGGGSFDRGLEEGGVVQFIEAIDLAAHAIHTYRANLKDPDRMRLFFGSVDDYIAQAIAGEWGVRIVRIGEIDFLCAGSPCVAFSLLQPNKQSDESLKNASLVASVVAFIDLYRPQYAVLENVRGMATTLKIGDARQNVFSQLLCALVGMGYQVNQFCLGAWSFGDAQSRSRLFVSITAPGLEPLGQPALTHSHPPSAKNTSLGKTINGERFGERQSNATPFKYVSAKEATQDLPWIGDSSVQSCIPFPDHRTSRIERALRRYQISMIPVSPPGQNFVKALKEGRLGLPHREAASKMHKRQTADNSRAWERVLADGLMPTITTACSPRDAFHGNILHWEQPRCLTVMEARRAQGFPDEEVIVGSPAHQWKIIGNSVARQVALAIGIALRDAWLASSPDSWRHVLGIAERVNVDTAVTAAEPLAPSPFHEQPQQAVSSQDHSSLNTTDDFATQRALREDLDIRGSFHIRRSSVTHRTRTTERAIDTTEVTLKTTISKTTRTLLDNKAEESAVPGHGTPPSTAARTSARRSGLAPEFTPTEWHQIPGRHSSPRGKGQHTMDDGSGI